MIESCNQYIIGSIIAFIIGREEKYDENIN